MSADLSAPRARTGSHPSAVPDRVTALDHPAYVLAPATRLATAPRAARRSFDSMLRLRPYLRPYRWRFVVMIAFAALGIGAVIVIPLVTRAVIDGPIAESDRAGLIAFGLLAIGLGVLEAVLMFFRRWIVTKGTIGVENQIRRDLYAKLQQLPMSFHSHWQSGQLLSRIMNDLSSIRRFLGFGLTFLIINVIQIGVVCALLISMYWPLGLIVLASTAPVVIACLRNEREYTRLSRQVQDQVGDVASTVEEGAYGLRVIKAFGRARHVFKTFDARSTRLYETSMARVRVSARFWTFLRVIPNVTLILVLGVGAVAAGQGRVSLGTLVAFITLTLSLVWPVAALGFLLAMTQEAMTAADRICEIFDAESEITDGERALEHPRGRVTFDEVSFRFPDAETDVLAASIWRSRRGRRSRSSARPAPARPPSPPWCRDSGT